MHWLWNCDDVCLLYFNSLLNRLHDDSSVGGLMITDVYLNNVKFTLDIDKNEDLSYLKFNKITVAGIEFDPKNLRQYDLLRLEREIFRKYFRKTLTVSK